MRTHMFHSGLVVALLALAPAATSQVLGTSLNYQLAAVSYDGGGGGASSVGYSAWGTLGGLSSEQLLSTNYKAGIGFLQGNDPQPTNAPIIFGITPDFGPKAGGTAVTIAGLNFDKFGTGPSVTVDIDGNAAAHTVVSNTVITATTPAGIHGPQALAVGNPYGTTVRPNAFVYTPALTTTAVAPLLAPFTMRNYGTVGLNYFTLMSLSTRSTTNRWGVFLLGTPFYNLLLNLPYSGPDGISTFATTIPNNPNLNGVTIYFQSLYVTSYGPVQGELTNLSQTFIP